MDKFSNETKAQLGFYVYRLIDPRNGNTFYVGKGQCRVFAHIKGALRDYHGEHFFADDDEDLKTNIIKEIRSARIEVLLVIYRHNMDA